MPAAHAAARRSPSCPCPHMCMHRMQAAESGRVAGLGSPCGEHYLDAGIPECMCRSKRQRQTQRDRHRQTQRDRHRETQRDRDRERETHTHTITQSHHHTHTHTLTHSHRTTDTVSETTPEHANVTKSNPEQGAREGTETAAIVCKTHVAEREKERQKTQAARVRCQCARLTRASGQTRRRPRR